MRAYLGGQRVSGHRNCAGKSRASVLIGAAVRLAECPITTTTVKAQAALPPATVKF
ncbi:MULTISPECIES: hypothetical protein [unclassified Bradyrhizobium]|uniref:hypothetical protein n=1 Tax=unclassified Bradyrhizobium TaxID=2631580 RepID=UPI002478588B|nr:MULTISPECIES: hypothetical protein [unclassified Bradyrhizobium]WGR72075.1 hypothetical protein MTX24_03735 [Bradyrhizobium sp. ISRA426]WGR76909.1 hypothetical protein MTX21_28685 [Bradyrhizobium sp. ISRA430]WGR87314.1 hypothetical protein MTX25_03735 [Bradyrhizobium sp. ISRA432]